MSDFTPKSALIVGAGSGLSASIARAFANEGIALSLAARNIDKLDSLANELEAECFQCDASDPHQVEILFTNVDKGPGGPADVVVYNPSFRVRGSITELDPAEVAETMKITAFGGFLVGQQAAKRMLKKGEGVILFTGASASIKGYPLSAPFAMGKFALRGLAQSMARELHPKNIHIAHINIDGGIQNPGRPERMPAGDKPDSMLHPDAIAQTYLNLIKQHRSAWSMEVELRPWLERF